MARSRDIERGWRFLPGALVASGALAYVALIAAALQLNLLPLRLTLVGPLPLMAAPALLLVGVMLAVLFARHQPFGLALLPAASVAVPFGLGTGTQSAVPVGLVLAVYLLLVWLVRTVYRVEAIATPVAVAWPTLALVGVWVLAFVHANATFDPLVQTWPTFPLVQLGQLAMVIVQAGVLLMASRHAADDRWMRLATWSLLCVGAIWIFGYYSGLSSITNLIRGRGLFGMWVAALALGQALVNERLLAWQRALLLGLVAACLYWAAIVDTAWLSGWIPMMIAILTILALRSIFAFGLASLAGVIFIALKFNTLYASIVDANLEEGSGSRLDIWKQAWDLLSQHVVLGTGPAGYAAYYMSLYRSTGFSMSTHNNYVDIAAQTGLLGLAIFGWFLLTLVIVGWYACRRHRDGFLGGFACAAFGGLIGAGAAMMLGDWVIPFVYNQTIAGFRYTVQTWIFVGFLIGLAARRPEPRVVAESRLSTWGVSGTRARAAGS